MSVALPFPLGLAQAAATALALRAGRRLWLIDKLITTNIDADFFGLLPCFDQARAVGELVEFHPHWDQLPKDRPETVLRLLVASAHDQAEFGKHIHDSYRQVKPPAVALLHAVGTLAPETLTILERMGFKALGEWPDNGPALVVVPLDDPSLAARRGLRSRGVLVLALGDFNAGVPERLAALDAGADAVATDTLELERELLWLEGLFLTGLGGEHDH
jgi:hypothetical protein